MANREDNLPGVSIIVPVYNNQDCIAALIESLLEQDYPKQLLEIIIVDNNSTDATREIIGEYPVKLLEEKQIQSSYAARNRGIENAACEILAFIDSDCVASKGWITQGVKVLTAQNADLVGGKVEFTFPGRKTAARMYDAITHIQVEKCIKEQNGAHTANLFVRRALFEKIGMFPERVASGGDLTWTTKATSSGYCLLYASQAVVKHPARDLKPLLKKRYRTGAGVMDFWADTKTAKFKIAAMILRKCLPRRISMISKAIDERGSTEMKKSIWSIWAVSYLCSLATVCGILASILGFSKKNMTFSWVHL